MTNKQRKNKLKTIATYHIPKSYQKYISSADDATSMKLIGLIVKHTREYVKEFYDARS